MEDHTETQNLSLGTNRSTEIHSNEQIEQHNKPPLASPLNRSVVDDDYHDYHLRNGCID